jgi:ATP synthase protein I
VFFSGSAESVVGERGEQDPLRDLEQRLERARRAQERNVGGPPAEGGPSVSRSALGLAFRIGLELVVAVVVGTAIGWGFDQWLGTRPGLTILFFFLGVGAGMVNVWRAVMGMGMAVGYRKDASPAKQKGVDWSDDED